jgi:tripartite-type tricarboxylate transporter receptor subunit TctC
VVTGEVLLTIADALPVAGQIRGNQVRALAITSKARSPEFPDIPTLAEAGVGDIEITLWSGVFAPARTPPAIVRKLEAEIIRVVRLPEVVERFRTLLVEPVGNSSADFARTISADIARWTGIAKAAGIEIR